MAKRRRPTTKAADRRKRTASVSGAEGDLTKRREGGQLQRQPTGRDGRGDVNRRNNIASNEPRGAIELCNPSISIQLLKRMAAKEGDC